MLTNTCKCLYDTEGSNLLGCNTVILGVQFSTFNRIIVLEPQDQMVKEELDCLELDFWYCLALKVEGITVFKMFGTAHPVTQHHISRDLILQQHHCKNLISLIFVSVYSNVILNCFFSSNVLIV